MKLTLLVVTYLIVAIKSVEIAEEKLIEDKLCIQAIEDALDVTLTIDGQIYESIVELEAINDKIDSDCDNILDVFAPVVENIRSDINADAVVTISLDGNNKKATSVNGVPLRKKQANQNDAKPEVTSFVAIFMLSLYDGEWYIKRAPLEDSTTTKLLSKEIASGIGNAFRGETTPDRNYFDDDGLVLTSVNLNKSIAEALSNNEHVRFPRFDLDNEFKINYLPDEVGEQEIVIADQLKNDQATEVKHVFSEEDRKSASPGKRSFFSYILGKPTCNQDEESYCSLDCPSLTCENHEKEFHNYLKCITSKYHQMFCIFGKWSKCECRIGLVRDTKNMGKCISSEYCPTNKSTTQNSITTESQLSTTTTSNMPTTRKPIWKPK